MDKEKKEIWKLRKLYRDYLTDDIKRDMYVNWADEKLIDLVEAEEVEEEDLYKFLNQLSVLKKFIKWLVENDKIDRDNARLRKSLWETDTSDIDKIIYTIKNSDYHYVMREAPYEAEETLLMLLSISDTPIEDLTSYLK